MNDQVKELLYQMLETEMSGVEVYTNALECVVNDDLKQEWEKYLEQTDHHVAIMRELFEKLGLDSEAQSPGRQIVHHLGESLVRAMEMARQDATPEAAELVACECVVLAETKDHQNWELLSICAEKAKGDEKKALTAACEKVQDQEAEHIYHSKGWCRELWIRSLGMPPGRSVTESSRRFDTVFSHGLASPSQLTAVYA